MTDAIAVKAPKTVGLNLGELTIREQAAAAWHVRASEGRYKAERAALNLATTIFGNDVAIEFDDFVPDAFAKRHFYEPRHLVTFAIEGLEFNYVEVSERRTEHFMLIDMCSCGRGPRLLAEVRTIADLGRAYDWDYSSENCADCKEDERKARASR